MANETGFTDIASSATAGTFDVSKYTPPTVFNPTFVKMIVLDVISDPNTELNDVDRKDELALYGPSNIDLINALPRNTILAQRVGEEDNPMFVFPFFPSHLSMPCKAGECVWVMIEKPHADRLEIAYWFSRVVEPHMADDVNYSQTNSSTDISMFPGTAELAKREAEGTRETAITFELRNGPTMIVQGERMTSPEIPVLKNYPEEIFEVLLTETKAATLTQYESIPRFRKRPGDVALEGSNNTLIVLGLERSGSIELPADQLTYDAGSIDMVVGRGYTADTSGKEAETTSIIDAKGSTKGTALKKELNKAPETLSPKEGDPDMKNDRSRIVLSQRTYVNKNFGIDAYNGQLAIEGVDDDLAGEPAITIKSDKIRLIARSDVQFIVTGFEAATTENKKLMKSELSVTGSNGRINWSSITMKSNGDIIFTPSDDGYVRLGGPDANLGIVCSDQPVTTTNGGVSGKPLKTTMGGAFAGAVAAPDGKSNKKSLNANGQGKYANKVLIK